MYFGILFKIVDTCKYIIILIVFRMIDRRKSNPEKLGGKRGVISVEIEKSIYQEIVKEVSLVNIFAEHYVKVSDIKIFCFCRFHKCSQSPAETTLETAVTM